MSALTRPTPIYTLVFLRVAVGFLGFADLLGSLIYYNWYTGSYAAHPFAYQGFEWVRPLPDPWLSLVILAGALAGIGVMLGWYFRRTAPLLTLVYVYVFLLDKANYLNHAYLFCWLSAILCLTPAWREWSLDVRRKPKEWSPTAPAWSVYVFPALMGLVYFFGGIAKINYDWLIEAMPMRMWLGRRSEMFLLGPVWEQELTAYVMSWGGMLLDLLCPFLLLHRRLRWYVLVFIIGFHLTNHLIFNIGIFPWLSLVLTSMFFEPDWPHRFVRWLSSSSRIPIWASSRVQRWMLRWQSRVAGITPKPVRTPQARTLALAGVLLFGFHAFLPLRHWIWPSDVNWSEQGHRYSWRMMLRSKQGTGVFRLQDRVTGEEWTVQPRDSMTFKQFRKMATHPDMILQYAHHLRDAHAEQGREVAVYANFTTRLNGRRFHPLVDDTVDLAREEWVYFEDKDWILEEGVRRN